MDKLKKENLPITPTDECGEVLGHFLHQEGTPVSIPKPIEPDLRLTPDQLRALKDTNQFRS